MRTAALLLVALPALLVASPPRHGRRSSDSEEPFRSLDDADGPRAYLRVALVVPDEMSGTQAAFEKALTANHRVEVRPLCRGEGADDEYLALLAPMHGRRHELRLVQYHPKEPSSHDVDLALVFIDVADSRRVARALRALQKIRRRGVRTAIAAVAVNGPASRSAGLAISNALDDRCLEWAFDGRTTTRMAWDTIQGLVEAFWPDSAQHSIPQYEEPSDDWASVWKRAAAAEQT